MTNNLKHKTMAGPFKLKSGNRTSFKNMGSSPVKQGAIPIEEGFPVLEEIDKRGKVKERGQGAIKPEDITKKEVLSKEEIEQIQRKKREEKYEGMGEGVIRPKDITEMEILSKEEIKRRQQQTKEGKYKGMGEGAIKSTSPTKQLPTYREAWANMSDKDKAKHGSYEAFKKAAIEYNQPKVLSRLMEVHLQPKEKDAESSPTKHIIGKHPSKKDGHRRSDHKQIKSDKKQIKSDKKKQKIIMTDPDLGKRYKKAGKKK